MENYFSISEQSTLGINLMTGFAEYDAPFYDRFYVGGYSFSQKGSYPLLGFDRDEILSDQVAVLGIQYRRRPVFRGYRTAWRRSWIGSQYHAWASAYYRRVWKRGQNPFLPHIRTGILNGHYCRMHPEQLQVLAARGKSTTGRAHRACEASSRREEESMRDIVEEHQRSRCPCAAGTLWAHRGCGAM